MRLRSLGYAVAAHRAQGVTTDTAHVLVEPASTRENVYVAMTRGRETNRAYVILDRPDHDHAQPHPADNPEATARGVLYGVLQHTGAELSAHETITAEQDQWGSIAQLAAEYETIASAAQKDRWATLLRASGLTDEQTQDAIASDAFGALSAELRRAEANHHDVDTLFPRLIGARSLDDADDIAAVIHDRVAKATARPAGSGRTRKAPRLIAGLVPEATGTMSPDMRHALDERRDLIEAWADALVEQALNERTTWLTALGEPPSDTRAAKTWRRQIRTVAAYRDRYNITSTNALGPAPTSAAQKIDAARARAALENTRRLSAGQEAMPRTPQKVGRRGPAL